MATAQDSEVCAVTPRNKWARATSTVMELNKIKNAFLELAQHTDHYPNTPRRTFSTPRLEIETTQTTPTTTATKNSTTTTIENSLCINGSSDSNSSPNNANFTTDSSGRLAPPLQQQPSLMTKKSESDSYAYTSSFQSKVSSFRNIPPLTPKDSDEPQWSYHELYERYRESQELLTMASNLGCSLATDLNLANESVVFLENALEEEQAQRRQMESRDVVLQVRLDQLSADKSRDRLEESLAAVLDDRCNLESKVRELSLALEREKSQCAKLQNKLENELAEIDSICANHENVVSVLKQEINNLNESRDDTIAENHRLKDHVTELKRKITKITNEVANSPTSTSTSSPRSPRSPRSPQQTNKGNSRKENGMIANNAALLVEVENLRARCAKLQSENEDLSTQLQTELSTTRSETPRYRYNTNPAYSSPRDELNSFKNDNLSESLQQQQKHVSFDKSLFAELSAALLPESSRSVELVEQTHHSFAPSLPPLPTTTTTTTQNRTNSWWGYATNNNNNDNDNDDDEGSGSRWQRMGAAVCMVGALAAYRVLCAPKSQTPRWR